MDYVKARSEANDRYAVTMHTVSSGLSYAKLDEDKLTEITIIDELNRPENNELRGGYHIGVIIQRGKMRICFISLMLAFVSNLL